MGVLHGTYLSPSRCLRFESVLVRSTSPSTLTERRAENVVCDEVEGKLAPAYMVHTAAAGTRMWLQGHDRPLCWSAQLHQSVE